MSLFTSLRLSALPVVVGAVFAGAVSVSAAEYTIDAAHSDIQFKVKHMGISTVTGSFGEFSGTFNVDPKNVKATTGSAVIKAASVNTNNERRDNHLKSDDFFNVEQFPEIKFVSKAVRNINMKDSTADLLARLTTRVVIMRILLKVKGTGILANDPCTLERAAFRVTCSFNRFAFIL